LLWQLRFRFDSGPAPLDGVVAVSDAGVDAGAAAEKMVQQFPSVALADDRLIVR
jgi:hypothetical protein